MRELHETILGRRLIENTLPEIARQLERVANALEKKDSDLVSLQQKYAILSSLNADVKSKHKMHITIINEMENVLNQIKKIQNG